MTNSELKRFNAPKVDCKGVDVLRLNETINLLTKALKESVAIMKSIGGKPTLPISEYLTSESFKAVEKLLEGK